MCDLWEWVTCGSTLIHSNKVMDLTATFTLKKITQKILVWFYIKHHNVSVKVIGFGFAHLAQNHRKIPKGREEEMWFVLPDFWRNSGRWWNSIMTDKDWGAVLQQYFWLQRRMKSPVIITWQFTCLAHHAGHQYIMGWVLHLVWVVLGIKGKYRRIMGERKGSGAGRTVAGVHWHFPRIWCFLL